MEITQERAEEIGKALSTIVTALNSIKEEELEELLRQINHDQGIGPLLDPTLWSRDGMMDASHKTKKVLTGLLEFKREVKGIGSFR